MFWSWNPSSDTKWKTVDLGSPKRPGLWGPARSLVLHLLPTCHLATAGSELWDPQATDTALLPKGSAHFNAAKDKTAEEADAHLTIATTFGRVEAMLSAVLSPPGLGLYHFSSQNPFAPTC